MTVSLRRLVPALLAGAAILSAAAPVAAGSTAALQVKIGDACMLGGHAVFNGQVTVSQSRNGTRIASRTVQAGPLGKFRVCLKRVLIGDTIAIKDGGVTRSLRIPTITIAMTATGHVTGTIAKANTPLTIEVRTLIGTWLTNVKLDNATSDAGKGFDWDQSLDPSPLALDGSDDASASVFTTRGDVITRYSGHLPSFVVRAGSPKATILDEPGHTVTLTLRSAAGAVRGTLTRTLTWPEASGSFTKNGVAVAAKAGDRISSSSLPGKELVVLADTLSVTAADQGSMAATCFPNSQWVALLMNGAEAADVQGQTTTAGDGAVSADPLAPTLAAGKRIPKGWRVVLSCELTPDGFVQQMVRTIP